MNDSSPFQDIDNQLNISRDVIIAKLIDKLEFIRGLKYYEKVVAQFGNGERTWPSYFRSTTKRIIHQSEIERAVVEARSETFAHMGAYNGGPEDNSSGGVFERIIHHKIFITENKPLMGSSYIHLPKELRNSVKGLVNPINKNDNECFRWCHLILKYRKAKDPGRISQYKQYPNQLDCTGVTFLVTEKQYGRIEVQNQI